MEKDILSKVIEVEKTIQQEILSERDKAEERVIKARLDAERDIKEEESRLKAGLTYGIEGAAADAEKRACNIVADAELYSERLDSLTDEELKAIIAGHIRKILPAPG